MLAEHDRAERLMQIAKAEGLYEEIRLLNEDGTLAGPVDDIPQDLMIAMYRQMVYARAFDRKAIALQRQGRIGTYAPYEGQEAAQVASALALAPEDWVFPSYRDHGATMAIGQSAANVLLYWSGRVEGIRSPEGRHILPPSVPIATHVLHAVGAAWASRSRREEAVSIAYFGDGATSEGDFHEALNFAGVFHLPVIFFCQNNGYAISVPFSRQSASRTIAQRAIAYDILGVRVDGNDAFAVYRAVKEARSRALHGLGPTLIEAVTFRMGAHTTADDPTRYRDQKAVVEAWQKRDPILRLRLYLESQRLWSDEKEAALQDEVKALVEQAVDEALGVSPPDMEMMFDHVYADEPWHLKAEREEYRRSRRGESA